MSGDEMEELRLGAAASVDRGLGPAKWCKIHIYTNMRVSGETRVRPNDLLTLHFKSRLVFSRGSSIRILSRRPIPSLTKVFCVTRTQKHLKAYYLFCIIFRIDNSINPSFVPCKSIP